MVKIRGEWSAYEAMTMPMDHSLCIILQFIFFNYVLEAILFDAFNSNSFILTAIDYFSLCIFFIYTFVQFSCQRAFRLFLIVLLLKTLITINTLVHIFLRTCLRFCRVCTYR